MRLIDADALIIDIKNAEKCYRESKCLGSELCPYKFAFADGAGTVADLIVRNAPTIEERKHGHWNNGYECSVCGAWMATDTIGDCLPSEEQHYCYNCGAKMDEVVNDENSVPGK